MPHIVGVPAAGATVAIAPSVDSQTTTDFMHGAWNVQAGYLHTPIPEGIIGIPVGAGLAIYGSEIPRNPLANLTATIIFEEF